MKGRLTVEVVRRRTWIHEWAKYIGRPFTTDEFARPNNATIYTANGWLDDAAECGLLVYRGRVGVQRSWCAS